MKIQFNEKLLKNINEDNREIGEILLFLIHRNINPIEFFSLYQGGLSKVNYCIDVFTRLGIIEVDDDADCQFTLLRPLYVNEKVNQERDIDDVRGLFFKSICGESRRNVQKGVAEYIMDKFLEVHPYDWSDIVKVSEEFMQDLLKKPEKERFIPSYTTFVEKNLLILLEEHKSKDKADKLRRKLNDKNKEDATYNDGGFSEFL